MPYSISVSNLDNNISFELPIAQADAETIKSWLETPNPRYKGRNVVDLFPATLTPVRTNNFKNFAKDFFLPTTINQAIKVQNIALRCFAILASLVLDVFTFPVRLLTCIPRIFSNRQQAENMLYKYLLTQNVDKELLESGHVRVKLEWESQSTSLTGTWEEGADDMRKEFNTEKHSLEVNVNFIEVPTYEDHEFRLHDNT